GFTGLTTLIKEIREFIPHNIFLEFEPGRILGYQAGKAYAEVLDVVSTSEGWDITLNISAGCHLWWSKPKLVINEKPEPGALLKKIRFFGPTCAENDCIGIFQLPTPYQIGDQVCFHNISTYSLMWNRQFNGCLRLKLFGKEMYKYNDFAKCSKSKICLRVF
ncbi:MAG: hypothetical protein HY072_06770, partial [Deltaproteobacteria bacterium]|nr:hypothetical protein [Deltaproteobacteria bacterium]